MVSRGTARCNACAGGPKGFCGKLTPAGTSCRVSIMKSFLSVRSGLLALATLLTVVIAAQPGLADTPSPSGDGLVDIRPTEPQSPLILNVLTFNAFLLPFLPESQDRRAPLMAGQLKGYDVVLLQEVFSDWHRDLLLVYKIQHMVPLRSRIPVSRQEKAGGRCRSIVKGLGRPGKPGYGIRRAAWRAHRPRCATLAMRCIAAHHAPRRVNGRSRRRGTIC